MAILDKSILLAFSLQTLFAIGSSSRGHWLDIGDVQISKLETDVNSTEGEVSQIEEKLRHLGYL